MKFTYAISLSRTPFSKNRFLLIISSLFLIFSIITFIGTTDLANWLLENTLVFIFIIVIISTYKKFQFSDLSYLLIFVFLLLHVYGAEYTYAENPFGYWLKDVLNLQRNQYDRIVHFSFGFLLAYPLRELFLIGFQFPKGVAWILPIEITLSIGAFYELIEWAVADLFFKEQGMAYLGTQGDVWDAQKDIFLAFIGAVIATTIISIIKKLGCFNIKIKGEE